MACCLKGGILKIVAVVFSIFVSLLMVATPASAEHTEFTVVVQDYKALPPYSGYENGDYTGFNRELLDMFANEKGYRFDYVAFPVKRLFFEFVNGVGDLKYPDNPNWALQVKKDAQIAYSDPVVEYVNGVMVLPTNKGRENFGNWGLWQAGLLSVIWTAWRPERSRFLKTTTMPVC